MTKPVLVWFRQDLRLADNPALHAAVATGAPLIALYILDTETPGLRGRGAASLWWLHHSLGSLKAALRHIGGDLILRRGNPKAILEELNSTNGIQNIFWNRLYESHARARDAQIKADLSAQGISVQSFNGSLLFEPWHVKTKTGGTPKTFTSFWRNAVAQNTVDPVLPAPRRLNAFAAIKESDDLADWGLLPRKPDWSTAFTKTWTPGEAAARATLGTFLTERLQAYPQDRDRPDRHGTSRLSPHLHFGEISPRTIWSAVHHQIDNEGEAVRSPAMKFLSEIGWREFSHALLYQHADMATAPIRPQFNSFPWTNDDSVYKAWCKGQTGYPIVDAGMRELWQTGYMHNRVRMIAASFLTKHLLVPWQKGEAWFWDTLVDADAANNAASWQWVAGCGADAAPYFRIFNPVLQGEKFDPQGSYVRAFVPEISNLPDKWLHHPWDAPESVLSNAGITMGADYPKPIVDHSFARNRALAAFKSITGMAAD